MRCYGHATIHWAYRVRSGISQWMTEHPQIHVREIVLDLTAVAYSWGDGPLVAAQDFRMAGGVERIRFVANAQNWKPLNDLLKSLSYDKLGFSVERPPRSFSGAAPKSART